MACRTPEEWTDTLERFMDDESARREAGEQGRRFAERYYSEEAILGQWDGVFASLFESTSALPEQSRTVASPRDASGYPAENVA
jgi:hypothetical protein